VITFHDDDAGYADWLIDNPAGYVLNVEPPFSVLHRADCPHLSPRREGRLTVLYPKVCSTEPPALEAPARWCSFCEQRRAA
jgi:hypothetical protein